ncbi:MAG: ADP-ribosylglycohydrolase family protein, partial [Oscillospiraceae bacterium]|nr:ADP-ribosylglycohydrolase family protein [Oscillospiraceae bacterium]
QCGFLELAGRERLAIIAPEHQYIEEATMDDADSPSGKIAMLARAVEYMLEKYPFLDASRVYLTGFSRGAMNVCSLALFKPELFAAAAPLSGLGLAGMSPKENDITLKRWIDRRRKTQGRPVAFLPAYIHLGGQDGVFTENRGLRSNLNPGGEGGAAEALAAFRLLNDLEAAPALDFEAHPFWGFPLEDLRSERERDAEFERGCLKNREGVELLRFERPSGFGHAFYPGYARRAWDFMRRFSRDRASGALIAEGFGKVYCATSDYGEILSLRAPAPALEKAPRGEELKDKLEGALLGRLAGCILGVPVEMYSVSLMEDLARLTNTPFPPTDYWEDVLRPDDIQYNVSPRYEYAKKNLRGVPVDDDIAYTLIGLLLMERCGFDFTAEDVAQLWDELVTIACTAEEAALKNYRSGVRASRAADINNPYDDWIGAMIRSDPFAWARPGDPERAARMAFYDASFSHRAGGIYGEMFWAAAQSAAFCAKNAEQALRAGLAQIPEGSRLFADLVWALESAPSLKDWREARRAVDERFKGMSEVHTNNNSCLAAFGLLLGGGDFTKTISITVAMGLDNDCTAATAGSLAGALFGKKKLSPHWYEPFGDEIRTYLKGFERFSIKEVAERFFRLASL